MVSGSVLLTRRLPSAPNAPSWVMMLGPSSAMESARELPKSVRVLAVMTPAGSLTVPVASSATVPAFTRAPVPAGPTTMLPLTVMARIAVLARLGAASTPAETTPRIARLVKLVRVKLPTVLNAPIAAIVLLPVNVADAAAWNTSPMAGPTNRRVEIIPLGSLIPPLATRETVPAFRMPAVPVRPRAIELPPTNDNRPVPVAPAPALMIPATTSGRPSARAKSPSTLKRPRRLMMLLPRNCALAAGTADGVPISRSVMILPLG